MENFMYFVIKASGIQKRIVEICRSDRGDKVGEVRMYS